MSNLMRIQCTEVQVESTWPPPDSSRDVISTPKYLVLLLVHYGCIPAHPLHKNGNRRYLICYIQIFLFGSAFHFVSQGTCDSL